MTLKRSRRGICPVAIVAVSFLSVLAARSAGGQAPKIFYACYVPLTGTVYRVNETDLKPTCTSTSHVLFNWTDGVNAVRTTDAAGGDVSGAFASLTVRGLQGKPVSATAPANGQFLAFDGTAWAPTAAPSGGSLPTNAAGAFDFGNVNGFVSAGSIGSGAIPASGGGTRLMWYPSKAAFRAGFAGSGEWNDTNIGIGSTAFGERTVASGDVSLAMGNSSTASGDNSIAIGVSSTASGANSIAMGYSSTASGANSIAMGYSSTASGASSIALGSEANTNGLTGSFVYSDATSFSNFTSVAANEFAVRAAGGVRLRTSTDLSTGCNLPAGSGTWSCTSSRFAKEDFQDLGGEEVLAKIARMPIQSWVYRTDSTRARHVGPTAQDFHAAFGLGTDDQSISLVDIDGVNLLGVQTLDRRTRTLDRRTQLLEQENARLREQVKRNNRENAVLRERLERLERAIQPPVHP